MRELVDLTLDAVWGLPKIDLTFDQYQSLASKSSGRGKPGRSIQSNVVSLAHCSLMSTFLPWDFPFILWKMQLSIPSIYFPKIICFCLGVVIQTDIKKLVFEGDTYLLTQQLLDIGIFWHVSCFKETSLPLLAKLTVSVRHGVRIACIVALQVLAFLPILSNFIITQSCTFDL